MTPPAAPASSATAHAGQAPQPPRMKTLACGGVRGDEVAPRACTALAERLRCVVEVQAGRVTIAEACAMWDVSTRTYYRWVAQKDRIKTLLKGMGGEGAGAEGEEVGEGVAHARRMLEKNEEHVKMDHGDACDGATHAVPIAPRPDGVVAAPGRGFEEEHARGGGGLQPSPGASGSGGGGGGGGGEAYLRGGRRYLGGAAGRRGDGAGGAGGDGGGELPRGTSSRARGPRKTRIVVRYGGRAVRLAWYEGATAAEIQGTIAARFGLEAVFFNLQSEDGEVVVVSEGVPSGTYDLLI